MERKSNSLINNNVLPPFASLKTKDMFKAIKYLVGENKKTISSLENKKKLTWSNFIYKIEESDDKISKAWAPVRHLNSVMNDSKIRKQYEKSLALLTSHYGKVGQNKKLFKQYEKFYNENKKLLKPSQKKIINKYFK